MFKNTMGMKNHDYVCIDIVVLLTTVDSITNHLEHVPLMGLEH